VVLSPLPQAAKASVPTTITIARKIENFFVITVSPFVLSKNNLSDFNRKPINAQAVGDSSWCWFLLVLSLLHLARRVAHNQFLQNGKNYQKDSTDEHHVKPDLQICLNSGSHAFFEETFALKVNSIFGKPLADNNENCD